MVFRETMRDSAPLQVTAIRHCKPRATQKYGILPRQVNRYFFMGIDCLMIGQNWDQIDQKLRHVRSDPVTYVAMRTGGISGDKKPSMAQHQASDGPLTGVALIAIR